MINWSNSPRHSISTPPSGMSALNWMRTDVVPERKSSNPQLSSKVDVIGTTKKVHPSMNFSKLMSMERSELAAPNASYISTKGRRQRPLVKSRRYGTAG